MEILCVLQMCATYIISKFQAAHAFKKIKKGTGKMNFSILLNPTYTEYNHFKMLSIQEISNALFHTLFKYHVI